jgi:hypothetical protein
MKVIVLPSGSRMAESCTPLFTVSIAPGQPPSRDVGDVPVQVVHREVQQGRAGAIGVASDLDPATVGHPPFDEPTLHRQVVGGTPEQTRIPSVRGLEVGHRDDRQDMINRHRLFAPLSNERTAVNPRRGTNPDVGRSPTGSLLT